MTTKIVFLYSELSGYFLACAKALVNKNVEVHIVRWPVNKEAPFSLHFSEGIHIYNKTDYDRKQLAVLIKEINPSLIVSSGWMDKDYLAICRQFKHKIPTVMSMDNHWRGTIKQYIATFLSPLFLHKVYSHIWIPGEPQMNYARKLGFKEAQIITGFYSADIKTFTLIAKEKMNGNIPKRFLYLGRYVKEKGLDTLFKAFLSLQKENPNDWELWCIGTGPLLSHAPVHEKIKHLGFKQPSELGDFIRQAGVFVLPSRYEPWGVVVHEMAVAGLPQIVSDRVGAATQFINDTKNGYIFSTDNVDDLKEKMSKIISTPNVQLKEMSDYSHNIGLSYSPDQWADTLLQLIL
jgi:glycosyltransferase involved in cell wall biosynthesis